MSQRGRPVKLVQTDGVEDIDLSAKRALIWQAFIQGMQLEQLMDLDEWADRYRVLPRETSSEYGNWRTSRFPFLRRIMKLLSPSSICREIAIMKGAQLGFTETAINWILYNAHCNPGPMMYLQKTGDAAQNFSNEKLKPSILACQAVHDILGIGKSKRYANKWDYKAYPGGFVRLGGANSTPLLRGSSIGRAICDEEDSYELNVGKEGSPVLLLKKRMVNFPDSKLFRLSTPVLKELSTIEPAFEAYSQERYYLPCPKCNPRGDDAEYMFWIEWEHIKWSKKLNSLTGLPTEIFLECPNCGDKIDEDEHKAWMLDEGDWFSEKTGIRERVGDVERASMHISSLYSPVGFFSWRNAVAEWLEYKATRDTTKLQVFINQTCAQTYYLQGSEISYNYLEQRRESYAGNLGNFDVPAGALCLTAGCDVQDDRIEVEVVGWGMLDENWSIDYAVIPGDTAMMGDLNGMLSDGRPSVWRLLDEYLYKRWRHECGVKIPIEVAMIDAGYKTDEVHKFCRLREGRRIFPIKGEEGWGKGMYKANRRRHEKYGTWLYYAYNFELKNKIYAQLQIDQLGPGFCHFPKNQKYGEAYFKGITCERRVPKVTAGRTRLIWETPSGARNEPIDCRSYALVAFLAYPVDMAARARSGMSIFQPAATVPVKKRRRGNPGL